MYNINMFGCGIRYWICKIPMEEFRQIETLKNKHKEEYENIFFDLDLLKKLGYSSWETIHNVNFGRGFIIRERNSIEIKMKSKRLKRFDSSELLYSPLMFQPYNLIKDQTNAEQSGGYKMIALIQLETGSFFKFKLDEPEFDINNLSFHLNYSTIKNYFNHDFITHLTYNGKLLDQKKEDVVCTGNRVVFL